MPNASKNYKKVTGSGIVSKKAVSGTPKPAATAAGAATHVVDDLHGKVLTAVRVHLVFWGSSWAGNPPPQPSSSQIASAVGKILASSYMTGLAQYRNAGGTTLSGTTLVTSTQPPNPFSDDDVARFLGGLIDDGTLPKPSSDDQLLYSVIMPTGVISVNSNTIGEHTFFQASDGANAHFAWVTNDGALDTVTQIFSHELAEACTDPEGDGFQVEPTSPSNWNEIGDVCEGSNAVVNGVSVQTYWSAKDGKCVAS